MTIPPTGAHAPDAERNRWSTYVAVLLLEAALIAGLWAFGQYFSS
jgi:hypothetical protein